MAPIVSLRPVPTGFPLFLRLQLALVLCPEPERVVPHTTGDAFSCGTYSEPRQPSLVGRSSYNSFSSPCSVANCSVLSLSCCPSSPARPLGYLLSSFSRARPNPKEKHGPQACPCFETECPVHVCFERQPRVEVEAFYVPLLP